MSNSTDVQEIPVAEVHKGRHRTVHVTYGDQSAEIDEQIAPLIKEMWKAGINTCQSCEDSPAGWVRIQFFSSFEVEMFLNAIGDFDDKIGSLHDRLCRGYDRIAWPRVAQWRYEIIVADLAVEEIETDGGGVQEVCTAPPEFAMWIDVYFPFDDLADVLKRIKRHNRKHVEPQDAEPQGLETLAAP